MIGRKIEGEKWLVMRGEGETVKSKEEGEN